MTGTRGIDKFGYLALVRVLVPLTEARTGTGTDTEAFDKIKVLVLVLLLTLLKKSPTRTVNGTDSIEKTISKVPCD